jgi:hypothetical protein
MTGQLVEIPFRGTGWVYLGDLQSRRGMTYVSRRLDPAGQSFILRADAPGTFELKFYKQDFIQDYILNDYIQIQVTDPPESGAEFSGESRGPLALSGERGRVIAEPRWPPLEEPVSAGSGEVPAPPEIPADVEVAVGPAAGPAVSSAAGNEIGGDVDTGETPAAGGNRAVGETSGRVAGSGEAVPASPAAPAPPRLRPGLQDDGIVPVIPPSVPGSSGPVAEGTEMTGDGESGEYSGYLRRAREEYQAGRIPSGIAILDEARQRYPWGSDEAWWLYGQLLEANSPRRDIRSALEYYRRLIREYPQSPLYADAQRRIAYLERYYFNIQ